jgi:hypothetical protein
MADVESMMSDLGDLQMRKASRKDFSFLEEITFPGYSSGHRDGAFFFFFNTAVDTDKFPATANNLLSLNNPRSESTKH